MEADWPRQMSRRRCFAWITMTITCINDRGRQRRRFTWIDVAVTCINSRDKQRWHLALTTMTVTQLNGRSELERCGQARGIIVVRPLSSLYKKSAQRMGKGGSRYRITKALVHCVGPKTR